MHTIKITVNDMYVLRELKALFTNALKTAPEWADNDSIIENLAKLTGIEKKMIKEAKEKETNV